MADINAYALGLELQLQTTSAFVSLNNIEKKLVNIEKKMASLGPSATATTAMEKQAEAVGLNVMEHHELEKAVNTLMDVEREWQKFNEEVVGSAEFLNLSIEEQQKQQQKLTDKYMAANKAIREIGKSHKEFNKDEKDMFKLGVDISKQMDDSIDQYKEVNTQLENHAKAIKILKPLLDVVGISQEEAANFVFAYSKGLSLASVALILLAKGLREVMAMQEAYAKTTFRALGSQLELIQQTNELRSTLGATTEQAIKTLTALADVGFRASDSISELAEANYMFSRSTGVTESITASYQRRLTTMGHSAVEATQSLAKMSAMIRNSGLSAQAAGQIISGLNKTLMRLNFAFGKKQAKETGEMIAKFGAAAHAAGGEADSLTQSLGMLATDGVELQRIMGATGIAYDANASKASNLKKLMKGAAGGFKDLGIQGDYVTRVLASMGFEDVALNSDLLNKKAKELRMTFDQYVDSMDQGANLTEDFNNAMATFKDSLHRILAPLLTLGAQLMDVIGPAIVALLKPLVWVASAIGSVVSFLNKIPGVSLLIKAAMMTWLVPSILKGITAFTGLGKLFPGLTKNMGGIAGAAKTAGPALLSFGGAMLKQVATGKLFSKETGGIIKGLGGVVKGLFSAQSAMAGAAGAMGEAGAAAAGAGQGLAGMGGGALQAAMGLAKAHPLITAIVAAVGAAFLVVPKLFEMFDSGDKKMQALSVTLMALFAPLVALYVQLRALWAIVKGVWEAVSEMMAEAFQPLADLWKELTGGPGKQTVSLMEFMNKAMQKVTVITKGLVKAFYPLVLVFKAIGVVVRLVADAIKWVVDKFKPLIEWVDKAIQKVSKFLGIEDEVSEKVEQAVEDMRTPYEKMWGTQQQINDALKEQHERWQENLKEAKAFSTPQIMQTIQAQGAPPAKQAEPVITPVITDQTARAKTEEHNDKMLSANILITELLSKMIGKVDNKADMGEMIELLKTWLPKIAEEKSGGLSTAANQWL